VKAAFLTGPRRIELHESDEPRPEPHEIVVQVGSVGICGTDLSIHTGKIPVDYPRVMGHEIVGTVRTAGVGVGEGERVLVDPGIACGRCRQCREGRTNICTDGWLVGRDRDGGLRELMTVPASNVHPLPDGIDPAVAPMLQVLATCVHAQRRTEVFPDASVVVLGLGVTGLLHLQLAKLRGAHPVVGTTRSAPKLALARSLGADLTIAADGAEAEAVTDALPGGADLVIECVGTVDAFARAMAMVRTGGRILAYGTMTETSGALPFYDLYHKELSIIGARSARVEDFPLAIDAVASGRIVLDPLVSGRHTLDDVDDAIRAAGAPGALKVLVDV
jgi:2-desacetyl-2-hydroxyethyl bacteriochlorophyllide A dehydrogenase